MAGYFMQVVAQGWLIYDLTGSSTWLGFVSFASGIPLLVLALPAGVLVDRFDRRTVLVVGQGLTALVAIILAVLIGAGLVEPWQVVLTALVSGCLLVLIIPARQALLPTTVPRPQLGSAIALLSIGQNSGRVVGPALTGLLIAAFGAAVAFGAQAIGFLLALLCAARMAPQLSVGPSGPRSAAQDLLEGLRYVREDPTVWTLLILQGVPAFLIMPYTQLLPIFASDILQAGPGGAGDADDRHGYRLGPWLGLDRRAAAASPGTLAVRLAGRLRPAPGGLLGELLATAVDRHHGADWCGPGGLPGHQQHAGSARGAQRAPGAGYERLDDDLGADAARRAAARRSRRLVRRASHRGRQRSLELPGGRPDRHPLPRHPPPLTQLKIRRR